MNEIYGVRRCNLCEPGKLYGYCRCDVENLKDIQIIKLRKADVEIIMAALYNARLASLEHEDSIIHVEATIMSQVRF